MPLEVFLTVFWRKHELMLRAGTGARKISAVGMECGASTPKVILGLSACLFGLALSLLLNFVLARKILRLEDPLRSIDRISGEMAAPLKPLVFVAHEKEAGSLLLRRFLQAVGLSEEVARSLPTSHPLLTPVEQLARYNPYPPLLAEALGGSIPGSISYGYLGIDHRYHQVTYYAGEADTTPSCLVQKVRGRYTGGGDYFLTYVILSSKDPMGRPELLDSSGFVLRRGPLSAFPEVDAIDWRAFLSGSSDSFEEIGFSLIATLLETLAVVVVAVSIAQRRRRTKVRST